MRKTFGVIAMAPILATAVAGADLDPAGTALAAAIEATVSTALEPLLQPLAAAPPTVEPGVLVRRETWDEVWPNADGRDEARSVTGEIWTAAIQACIDRHQAAFLPARAEPYYLDGPIVLRSGCRLLADPKAEFRLKPGTNTCMVRNANLVNGQDRPLPDTLQPDVNIVVEGGIWTTLRTATQAFNGNPRGRADQADSIPGAHGMLLFNNVRGLLVRGVTIRQGTPFGLQLAAVSHFLIEGITFADHHRDGVHLLGLCKDGIVRHIRGVTYDDFVALNAWDWKNYSTAFGPIERILVEDIRGTDEGAASLRLLPGVKRFADGSTLDCPVRSCVFRNIAGLFDVKLYDQPNLELGAANDFSQAVGQLADLHFRQVIITRPQAPATLQVQANLHGLTLDDVVLAFAASPAYRLVSIGPLSMTYKFDPVDPAKWVEVFAPDRDCSARNLALHNVRRRAADGTETVVTETDSLVQVIEQTLNPDYPKTTPRGGTGKGTWRR
jgi:hypothetical protein